MFQLSVIGADAAGVSGVCNWCHLPKTRLLAILAFRWCRPFPDFHILEHQAPLFVTNTKDKMSHVCEKYLGI